MNKILRTGAVLALLAGCLAAAGCGYALAGRGSFLPAYIQTIGVPVFENTTPVFTLEQVLTAKVRAEFIGRGKYKVVPDITGADAVLIGRITGVGLVPVSFTNEQQASRYEMRITAAFEFRDQRDNKILWENPSVVFSEEYEISTTGAVDPSAFLGQEANAVDRLATGFARSVVSAIVEAF